MMPMFEAEGAQKANRFSARRIRSFRYIEKRERERECVRVCVAVEVIRPKVKFRLFMATMGF